MNIKTIIMASVLGILLGADSFAAAEVVVITNKSTPVSSLTADQVTAIFLKKTDVFPDGSRVEPIDLPPDHAVRDEFYTKAANKNQNQLKSYWAKRVFTGKGTPNNTQSSENAVKQWVAGGAGRIGYVSPAAVDGSVKVLLKLP